MIVNTSAGSRWGKVVSTAEESFVVRHGRLLAEEIAVPYAEAKEREGEIWLTLHGRFQDEELAPDGLSAVSAGPASRK
jgi:hypothetical protein